MSRLIPGYVIKSEDCLKYNLFSRILPGVHIDFESNIFYEAPIGGSPLFASTSSFDDLFTCTGSGGVYFDSSGVMQNATTNKPRLSYNFVTPSTSVGEYWGLIAEQASTNLCLWSRDLTNAAWVATNVTTAKTSTGLDNSANSCTRLTSTAGNGTVLQTFALSSAARVYSVYIKRITGSGNIQLTQNNGTNWTTVSLASSGWNRVSLASTILNPVIGIRIVTSGDAIDVDCNQYESWGSTGVGSTPILTTSATAARTQDKYSRVYAAGSTVVDRNDGYGAMYCKGRPWNIGNGLAGVIAGGASASAFAVGTNGFLNYNNGASLTATLTNYTLYRGCGTSGLTNVVALDGVGNTSNPAAAGLGGGTSFGTFAIGDDGSFNRPHNGAILKFHYWPYIVLGNSECQALSSQG